MFCSCALLHCLSFVLELNEANMCTSLANLKKDIKNKKIKINEQLKKTLFTTFKTVQITHFRQTYTIILDLSNLKTAGSIPPEM